jgi:sRNA-binding regulator protein Hfq
MKVWVSDQRKDNCLLKLSLVCFLNGIAVKLGIELKDAFENCLNSQKKQHLIFYK